MPFCLYGYGRQGTRFRSVSPPPGFCLSFATCLSLLLAPLWFSRCHEFGAPCTERYAMSNRELLSPHPRVFSLGWLPSGSTEPWIRFVDYRPAETSLRKYRIKVARYTHTPRLPLELEIYSRVSRWRRTAPPPSLPGILFRREARSGGSRG